MKSLRRTALMLAMLGLLAGAAGRVEAGVITGLWNTGVDGGGVAQPNASGELHYTLTSVPGGTTTILTRTSAGGFPIPPWLPDDSVSSWIGPNNTSSLNGPVGDYVYRLTFAVSSDTNVRIDGRWAVDNEGEIFLNGPTTGNSITTTNADSFSLWHGFSITSGFVLGTNTLDFVVHNDDGPTGLRVEMVGTGDTTAVPEPSTLASVGIAGLIGLAAYRRRFRANS